MISLDHMEPWHNLDIPACSYGQHMQSFTHDISVLNHIVVNFVLEKEVLALLNNLRAKVLEVRRASAVGNSFIRTIYWLTK
jgi:hypothetical protein